MLQTCVFECIKFKYNIESKFWDTVAILILHFARLLFSALIELQSIICGQFHQIEFILFLDEQFCVF